MESFTPWSTWVSHLTSGMVFHTRISTWVSHLTSGMVFHTRISTWVSHLTSGVVAHTPITGQVSRLTSGVAFHTITITPVALSNKWYGSFHLYAGSYHYDNRQAALHSNQQTIQQRAAPVQTTFAAHNVIINTLLGSIGETWESSYYGDPQVASYGHYTACNGKLNGTAWRCRHCWEEAEPAGCGCQYPNLNMRWLLRNGRLTMKMTFSTIILMA